jgi:hypothetical protein
VTSSDGNEQAWSEDAKQTHTIQRIRQRSSGVEGRRTLEDSSCENYS